MSNVFLTLAHTCERVLFYIHIFADTIMTIYYDAPTTTSQPRARNLIIACTELLTNGYISNPLSSRLSVYLLKKKKTTTKYIK